MQLLEHPSSASQDEDSDDMDFSAPLKSRLSGPQLQAQLSRLTDRSRLRRLKDTLLSKGAWQQVTRIEDLCHAQVSHKWLYHLDACAGSVLTPHDYITNVQKRLGNRALGGRWPVPMLWLLLGSTAGTRRNLRHRRSHAGALRVCSCRGVWHETGRPWLPLRNPVGSQLRNRGRLIFSLPLLSPDAVRPWTCAWPPPLQWQPAEVTAEAMKSEN